MTVGSIVEIESWKASGPLNTPVTLGLRPATTAKFSVVFGSLVDVADHRAMVLLIFGPINANL